ncbi:hypothetical protein AC622_01860 [Bacillus sp. FJAT-27916]|nr:hypothetical protein AC622_01860 [Bacillus sp. FJAT-27916]
MYNMSFYQFTQEKKRKEMKALEEKLQKEEAQLRLEYEEYIKAEDERRRAERIAKFGENANVRELRVVDGVPIIFSTDGFSKVVDAEVVKDLEQLSHQQRSELYTLERGVYGRLESGFTNYEIDEELVSRAFNMKLESFDQLSGIHEKGKKLGYSKSFVDQQLELYPMDKLEGMMDISLKQKFKM